MKKTMAFIICLSLLFQTISLPVFSGTKLTFSEMFKSAEDNSGDIAAAEVDIIKTEKKIKEAKKFKRDQILKSMWLFTRKYQYPKIMGIRTKVPESEHNHFMAKKEKGFVIEKLHYDLELLYTNIYITGIKIGRKKVLLQKTENRLRVAKSKLRAKLIEQAQVDEVVDQIETIKTELTDLEAELVSLKIEMSELMGKDVTRGYTFDMEFIYLEPSQIPLAMLIYQAIENNATIYKMRKDIEYTETRVNVIKDVYNDEFSGSLMGSLNRLASIGYENIKPKDLTSSYLNFEKMVVARWGDDWKSYYGIDLFFFEIKLPKIFRFGEFDGVRFLDDGRYAFMSEAFDLIKKINKLKTTENKIALSIKANYMMLRSKAKMYKTKIAKFKEVNKTYELNQKKFDAKLVTADELIANKEEIQALDAEIFDLLVDMTNILKELNLQTGGYLEPYLRGEKPLSDMSKDAPFLPLEDEAGELDAQAIKALAAANKPKGVEWVVTPVVKDMSSEFKLIIPGEVKFESYALFTIDGKKIGEKAAKDKGVKHLNIVLEDRTQIVIKFYKGSEVIDTGIMEGFGSKGAIKFLGGGTS